MSPVSGKNGNRVFTLEKDGNGGAAGYISNFDGSNKTQIFDTQTKLEKLKEELDCIKSEVFMLNIVEVIDTDSLQTEPNGKNKKKRAHRL